MIGVMLDLETMGNGNNAAITAIGAVMFDTECGITAEFYTVVDLASSVALGGVMDASTVLWWMKQSDAARGEFAHKGLPLPKALGEFNAWLQRGVGVWGNGATFDNVILRNAYKSVGVEAPWSFRDDRCYRTLKALHPGTSVPAIGTAHNALDDAKYQAATLIEIFKQGGMK